MDSHIIHPWNVNPATAQAIQTELVKQLVIEEFVGEINTIAGSDVSISKDGKLLIGGFVVFKLPDFQSIAHSVASQTATFPYIPGLLSFREIPVLLQAWQALDILPDLIFCDGQGIAHPRGFGLASHLGLLLKRPTIGCAKKRLIGEYDEVGEAKGSWKSLTFDGKTIGCVLRTRDNVKPVFVSPGNRIDVHQSREWVSRTCTKYRLPDPIRAAHRLVNEYRSSMISD